MNIDRKVWLFGFWNQKSRTISACEFNVSRHPISWMNNSLTASIRVLSGNKLTHYRLIIPAHHGCITRIGNQHKIWIQWFGLPRWLTGCFHFRSLSLSLVLSLSLCLCLSLSVSFLLSFLHLQFFFLFYDQRGQDHVSSLVYFGHKMWMLGLMQALRACKLWKVVGCFLQDITDGVCGFLPPG